MFRHLLVATAVSEKPSPPPPLAAAAELAFPAVSVGD